MSSDERHPLSSPLSLADSHMKRRIRYVPSSPLPLEAYAEPDPVRAARFFLGKALVVPAGKRRVVGLITETEAYGGRQDKACHGYNGRRTPRTEIMFGPGGRAYVYLCYGIHQLFNIVTGPADEPMAVLVRAVHIVEGHDLVRKRRPGIAKRDWASGPGRVTSALGITAAHNHAALTGKRLWIEDQGITISARQIEHSPRIGIGYAGEWAQKPWRFVWKSPGVKDF